MYRTHTCGCLRLENAGEKVTLAGWIQRIRKMGGMSFIDLRDRYGITQLVINENTPAEVREMPLGREYVIQVVGLVAERQSKNNKIETGDIEVLVENIKV
ncbi:MAG: aspartate--tRNA ligase, partial [Bacteroidales bacterium]|nr:aspartate--tRNA ligase [Bacteroidales bacterium]